MRNQAWALCALASCLIAAGATTLRAQQSDAFFEDEQFDALEKALRTELGNETDKKPKKEKTAYLVLNTILLF